MIDTCRYFEGQLASISEGDDELDVEPSPVRVTEAAEKVLDFLINPCGVLYYAFQFLLVFFFPKASLLEEQIKPRANLPPLLVPLRDRRPERLHYLGVSFGLTLDLFRFWRKHKFAPFYISQIPVENLFLPLLLNCLFLYCLVVHNTISIYGWIRVV